ncbi:MAG: hypothetical protein QXW70_02445 [Candidatus Anstonellales archaeon]
MLKKALILLLIIVLFAITSIFFFQDNEKEPALNREAEALIQPAGCGIANAEGSYAAYCNLLLDSPINTSITAGVFPKAPSREVYFFEYPHIESKDYEALNDYLKKKLFGTGIFFSSISANRLNSVSDSILIVPTGVFPKPIYENILNITSKRNVIVYLGLPPIYLLEQDGSIVSNPENALLFSGKEKWNTIPLGDSYIYYSPLSLDKFNRAKEAGEEILNVVLRQPWLGGTFYSITLPPTHSKKTIFFPSQFSEGYLRLFSFTPSNTFLLDEKAKKPPGNLLHSKVSAASKELELQAAINRTFSSSVFLSFSLSIIKDGVEVFRTNIGNASMREIWFRTFPLQVDLQPGDYLLIIHDQYMQTHTKSYLHVKNITVSYFPYQEGLYSFLVSEDGKPMSDTYAEVYVDNATYLGRHPIVGGTIRLSPTSMDKTREHNFRFKIEGKEILTKAEPPHSVFSFYSTYGLPALLLIIGIYLFFKRRGERLVVVFPDVKHSLQQTVRITKGEALEAINSAHSNFPSPFLGLTLQDIRRALQERMRLKGKDVIFSDENVLEILNSLASEGKVRNYLDHYVMHQADPKRSSMLRTAYDFLLSSGKKFKIKKDGSIVCGEDTIEIHTNTCIPKLPQRGRLILLFESEQEMEEFKGQLRGGEKELLALSLALRSGKLLLSTILNVTEIL